MAPIGPTFRQFHNINGDDIIIMKQTIINVVDWEVTSIIQVDRPIPAGVYISFPAVDPGEIYSLSDILYEWSTDDNKAERVNIPQLIAQALET